MISFNANLKEYYEPDRKYFLRVIELEEENNNGKD